MLHDVPALAQGLISSRPRASKAAVLRVASCPSWARAVAAITASAVLIGRAMRSRWLTRAAYQCAAALLNGSTGSWSTSATRLLQLRWSCCLRWESGVDEDDDEQAAGEYQEARQSFDWEALGSASFGMFRTAPTVDFMLGPYARPALPPRRPAARATR